MINRESLSCCLSLHFLCYALIAPRKGSFRLGCACPRSCSHATASPSIPHLAAATKLSRSPAPSSSAHIRGGNKGSEEERSIEMSSSLCLCEKCMSSLVSAECSLGAGLGYVSWQLNPRLSNTPWLTLFSAVPVTAEEQAPVNFQYELIFLKYSCRSGHIIDERWV